MLHTFADFSKLPRLPQLPTGTTRQFSALILSLSNGIVSRLTSGAHNAVWPILYPDPEELPIALEKLLDWVSGCIAYIEHHHGLANIEDFKTTVLAKW
jgi:hypothetical protein